MVTTLRDAVIRVRIDRDRARQVARETQREQRELNESRRRDRVEAGRQAGALKQQAERALKRFGSGALGQVGLGAAVGGAAAVRRGAGASGLGIAARLGLVATGAAATGLVAERVLVPAVRGILDELGIDPGIKETLQQVVTDLTGGLELLRFLKNEFDALKRSFSDTKDVTVAVARLLGAGAAVDFDLGRVYEYWDRLLVYNEGLARQLHSASEFQTRMAARGMTRILSRSAGRQ